MYFHRIIVYTVCIFRVQRFGTRVSDVSLSRAVVGTPPFSVVKQSRSNSLHNGIWFSQVGLVNEKIYAREMKICVKFYALQFDHILHRCNLRVDSFQDGWWVFFFRRRYGETVRTHFYWKILQTEFKNPITLHRGGNNNKKTILKINRFQAPRVHLYKTILCRSGVYWNASIRIFSI